MARLQPRCSQSPTPQIAKHLLITGASGALGRALALYHAGPDTVLSLWGRNEARLANTAEAARAAGAEASERSLDLTDCDAAVAALVAEDSETAFDVVYLVAGIGDVCPVGALVEPPEQVARVVQTNFTAPAAMATAIAERMAKRGRGRIVIIGSAAGHHALPSAASYAASKAGTMVLAESLHADLRGTGVQVQIANPGFIRTRLTAKNDFSMAQIMEPEDAALRMFEFMSGSGFKTSFPSPFAALFRGGQLLPDWAWYGMLPKR